ncbi:MAG TPA: NAD-binding protein [Bryobacteraceae bacterium]|jgi:voltage-gated potassium channel|nr:NAD-binding protein [Bryobacteraceae bacterium]
MKRRLLRRALLTASLLVSTFIVGVTGFCVIEGWGVFDAFYMTLITISTVGYGEVHRLSPAGRIFNSLLIFFGVIAMFFAVGALTQTIIELELQDLYGRRRRKRMIAKLQNHFIVCGFGRVGRNASYELQRANVPFVVVDKREERVSRAMEAGMLAVIADATNDDDLRAAGVLTARGLIAALPSDAENLFIILSAKALNSDLLVVTRASEEQAEQKLRRAGAHTVFAPYTMAGRRLAHALLRPHVVEFLDLATTEVGPQIMVEQVCVRPGTRYVSKTTGAMLSQSGVNVILLAIRHADGEMKFNPPPDSNIAAGDFLIVLGERPNLKKLEEALTGK